MIYPLSVEKCGDVLVQFCLPVQGTQVADAYC